MIFKFITAFILCLLIFNNSYSQSDKDSTKIIAQKKGNLNWYTVPVSVAVGIITEGLFVRISSEDKNDNIHFAGGKESLPGFDTGKFLCGFAIGFTATLFVFLAKAEMKNRKELNKLDNYMGNITINFTQNNLKHKQYFINYAYHL